MGNHEDAKNTKVHEEEKYVSSSYLFVNFVFSWLRDDPISNNARAT